MQIEAIVENEQPNLAPELLSAAQQMLTNLGAIRHAPLPPNDELPELTAKQLHLIKAFELRAEIRAEQGRPV